MLCHITMSSQVLTHGEQLAGLASRTITEALGTEPEGDDDARAMVSVLSDIYVSLLGHNTPPAWSPSQKVQISSLSR